MAEIQQPKKNRHFLGVYFFCPPVEAACDPLLVVHSRATVCPPHLRKSVLALGVDLWGPTGPNPTPMVPTRPNPVENHAFFGHNLQSLLAAMKSGAGRHPSGASRTPPNPLALHPLQGHKFQHILRAQPDQSGHLNHPVANGYGGPPGLPPPPLGARLQGSGPKTPAPPPPLGETCAAGAGCSLPRMGVTLG